MSVGAVGSVGSAGNNGGGTGVGETNPVSTGGDVGGIASGGNNPGGGNPLAEVEKNGPGNIENFSPSRPNISTQDHLHLRKTSMGIECPHKPQELDLKKLLEMVMAIKLLQEMNKMMNSDEGKGGNLNIIA